jgi:hypothetical protein
LVVWWWCVIVWWLEHRNDSFHKLTQCCRDQRIRGAVETDWAEVSSVLLALTATAR